jgi:hypothetical protein
MDLGKVGHLTYCTNIHAGESWEEVFQRLKDFVIPIKASISPDQPFGIGLRLSNKSSCDLINNMNLHVFKKWLELNGLYVFTINGFPYGEFHGQKVKDQVHQPDWTTSERLAYTLRLAKILAFLLPENMDGGISTSPLSYKPWLEAEKENTERVFTSASNHMFALVEELIKIKKTTGKVIHIDIEPEPDGLIENSGELVEFFKFYLLPEGKEYLKRKLGITSLEAKEAIQEHVRACYDVCHHAVAYEKPEEVFDKYKNAGILIGKIQISAALKVLLADEDQKAAAFSKLKLFEESTYLHQVVERRNGKLYQYPDLTEAFKNFNNKEIEEWRIHFHVPLFVDHYDNLFSTQEDILETLKLHMEKPVTNHLEVETYTWDVLPSELKLDLKSSIERELLWTKEVLSK